MRKRISAAIAVAMSVMVFVGGCGLNTNETEQAEEFVNDEIAATADSSEEVASTDTSLVVVNGLIEPTLEESSASASTSTVDNADSAASDSATTASTVEEVDKNVMVFMGDSQFANGRGDGTDIASIVGQKIPDSEVYNLAIGGTTATLETSTANSNSSDVTSNCFWGMANALAGIADRNAVLANYPEILETMNKIDVSKVDFYVIEYGTNDFFNGVPLDHTQTAMDPVYSYYEVMGMAIDVLRKASPNAEFIIMSPVYGVYEDENGNVYGDSYVVSNGLGTLSEYAQKSKNVAEDNKAYDLDCMFRSFCDLYIDTASQYLLDGVHLTLTGRQIFARILTHLIAWRLDYEPYAYLENDYINIANFNPDETYRYSDDLLKEYYPESYEKMMNGEYRMVQPQ